jgi:hypothetical protein
VAHIGGLVFAVLFFGANELRLCATLWRCRAARLVNGAVDDLRIDLRKQLGVVRASRLSRNPRRPYRAFPHLGCRWGGAQPAVTAGRAPVHDARQALHGPGCAGSPEPVYSFFGFLRLRGGTG